jgi:hypothetical protein
MSTTVAQTLNKECIEGKRNRGKQKYIKSLCVLQSKRQQEKKQGVHARSIHVTPKI